MPELAAAEILLLVVISLLAGIGITAIGPGGVLMTIALFALTDLSPASVAGTSIVTHVGTGLVGTWAFWKAGQFETERTWRLARILCATTVVGIPLGIGLNSLLAREAYGMMLGLFSGVIGMAVWYREQTTITVARTFLSVRDLGDAGGSSQIPTGRLVLVGILVAAISSLFGLGGPMICVPGLVAIGVPMLPALAAAQAQSIIIASLGAAGYVANDAINWPLAILTAIPQMIGVVLGARIAQSVPTRGLKFALAAVLVVLAPYLAFWR